jgi:phenylacetate-CoA ligase
MTGGLRMPNFARIAYYLVSGLQRLHWSRRKLKKYQDRRIRAIVRHAYDFVPFYREKFRIYGVSICDIKTVEDLSKLPLLTKDDLKGVPVSNLVAEGQNISSLKQLRTSGSTGRPFRIFINSREDDWRKAIYLRANISCGQRPKDSWAFVTAPRHFGDIANIQRRIGIFEQKLISVFAHPSYQLQLLREIDPDILDGYSGALFLIAKEAEKLEASNIHPKIMFGSSDSIDPAQRKFMENIFACKYLDQYGCSEVNRIAWQCPEQLGYHMDVDSVITQIVDEEGFEVSKGEEGEVVLTSLYNFTMPLIRYSLGDIGRLSEDTCSCWRSFPLMKSIEGRRDSFIKMPGGELVSPRVLTVGVSAFRFYSKIDQFRIVQKRPDFFEVSLKVDDKQINRELLAEELDIHLRTLLEAEEKGVVFNVKFVDSIPLSETGRLGAVFSEVS